MNRQTALGFLFLVVGLAILAAVGVSIVSMFSVHQWPPVMMLWFVLVGLGTALFGAFLLPNSGAAPTFNTLLVTLSKSNLPFVGRRVGDKVTAETPVTTTTTKEDP